MPDFLPMTIDWLAELTAAVQGDAALAVTFLALTAVLVAGGVPGVIMPLSFSSGALLGGWQGMLVVACGAVLGSQALFVLIRSRMQERVRKRWAARLAGFEKHLSERGFFYLVGLRLAGAPHFVVTAGAALTSLPARSFAGATLAGLLPVIALTAAAGSTL